MEYCILSASDIQEVRSELDESDDENFLDIFRFFASRDMHLEATILDDNTLAIVTETGNEKNIA